MIEINIFIIINNIIIIQNLLQLKTLLITIYYLFIKIIKLC